MKEKVGTHPWTPKGWRFWICRLCFAPRSLHPRRNEVWGRPANRNEYLAEDAPHFQEGW